MPTQRDARLTLQRAWRKYAGLNNRRSTCKLVSRMDTLRTDKSAKVKTTAFFSTYLRRLVCLSARVLKQADLLALFASSSSSRNTKHILDVLILGVVNGSKVARGPKLCASRRLWDAFEAAHLHLNAELQHPTGAPLLPRALALSFIHAGNAWLKAHAALETFKHSTAQEAAEWSRVALMQRMANQTADRLERAFLKLNEIPCTLVSEAQLKAAAAFHPLPDPSLPIFSMPSQLTPEGLSFLTGDSFQEEQVVHATLLDPEFQPLPPQPSSFLLDHRLNIYTRVPHALRTEVELGIAHHALWRTLEEEMRVGDYRRALAVCKKVETVPNAETLMHMPALKALVEAKELQTALAVNTFISNVKPRVLQDDQGFDYERTLFHSRLLYGTPLNLKGTLAWFLHLMPSLSTASLEGLAKCNTVALKEVHAFAIMACVMYPHLLLAPERDVIETLVHDVPLLKSLSVAFAALVDALQCSRQVLIAESHQEVLKFLVWEALDTPSASRHRDLLYALDEWGLTSRVCNLVRVNASVHWDIYQHLLPYAAQQYLAYKR
jgi:hypothetical protein